MTVLSGKLGRILLRRARAGAETCRNAVSTAIAACIVAAIAVPVQAMPVVDTTNATVAATITAGGTDDLLGSAELLPACTAKLTVTDAGDVVAQSCPPPPRCQQDERPCYLRRDSNGCLTWRCCKR